MTLMLSFCSLTRQDKVGQGGLEEPSIDKKIKKRYDEILK
jgi:hypothetical protein